MTDEITPLDGRRELYSSGRRFQLWDYSPSHQQLLIRSPAGKGTVTNVDLRFEGVEWMQLHPVIDNLRLTELPVGRLPLPEADLSLSHLARAFSISASNTGVNFVVASDYRIAENELDIFTSTLSFKESPAGRAKRYEKAVAATAGSLLPGWRISTDAVSGPVTLTSHGASPDRRVDVIAQSPDGERTLFIEAKSYRHDPTKQLVTRSFDSFARAVGSDRSRGSAAMLMIVEWNDSRAIEQLEARLQERVDIPIGLVGWLPMQSSLPIERAITRLVYPYGGGPAVHS